MDGGFLMKLLCQMFQPFQTPDLAEDPLLVALLGSLQSVPRPVDVLTPSSRNQSLINVALPPGAAEDLQTPSCPLRA